MAVITFAEQHTLATDMNFVAILRQALLTKALAVLVEAEANYNLYQARQSLALRVINNPIDESKRLAYALVTYSPYVTLSQISDAQIANLINGQWTTLSGYNPNAPEAPAP